MAKTLTYQEAKEIYETIQENLDRTDPDIVGLYNDMVAYAIQYAHIRAGWNALTVEKKRDTDDARTKKHDAFIASVNIVARTQGTIGAAWRQQLSDDRKRIGDLACYIALFEGPEAR